MSCGAESARNAGQCHLCEKGNDMTDERYKKLMADVGMPESKSLFIALHQVANEVEQECNAKHAEQKLVAENLASLVFKLAAALRITNPELANRATTYLSDNGFLRSPLRDSKAVDRIS